VSGWSNTRPWQGGRILCWYITINYALADSYVSGATCEAGSATDIAAFHSDFFLDGRYAFQPIAIENPSVFSSTPHQLISDLDNKITKVSGKAREVSFLFHRVMHIQHSTYLNSCTHSNSFIRIDRLAWRATKQLIHCRLNLHAKQEAYSQYFTEIKTLSLCLTTKLISQTRLQHAHSHLKALVRVQLCLLIKSTQHRAVLLTGIDEMIPDHPRHFSQL